MGCASGRSGSGDLLCILARSLALIMEKVAIDMAAWVQDARARGYEKIILVGWSGGGSLSLFYQAEAEAPSITATPAGDLVDLTQAGLEPADGVIFIAAHLSRAETLTEWLDPSVTDELDPDRRELAFDIYDNACLHQPPYTDEFVQRFRAAQIARNRKITECCRERLDTLRRRGTSEVERCFVVHRTMCDVRWLDPSIDPNGRRPGWCYLGDPRAVNTSPAGLGRYSSLRSWLSQWSYDLSNAKGPKNTARIRRTPVLQVEKSGGRRRARLPQSDDPLGPCDRRQGICWVRRRDALLSEPTRPVAAMYRRSAGLEPPQGADRRVNGSNAAYGSRYAAQRSGCIACTGADAPMREAPVQNGPETVDLDRR